MVCRTHIYNCEICAKANIAYLSVNDFMANKINYIGVINFALRKG